MAFLGSSLGALPMEQRILHGTGDATELLEIPNRAFLIVSLSF